MRSCINRLIAQPHVDGPKLRFESEFLSNRLEICRLSKEISNDAYLDAGIIQGALEMVANHAEMGVPQTEIHDLLVQQLSRADKLEEKHPGLDSAIEKGR